MAAALPICMKTSFETETCSRCNGSGKYSYCERYADRCFKCAGSKVTYTKRGAAARVFYEKLCTLSADQIKIGDRIAASGITHGASIYNTVGVVVGIKTEQRVTETTRTLREDGSFFVSHKSGSIDTQGQIKYDSSGSTVEFKGENKGEAGLTVERYTQYIFEVTTKYGKSNQTTSSGIRAYPVDNTEQVRQALDYQASLTKQGKPRKIKGVK